MSDTNLFTHQAIAAGKQITCRILRGFEPPVSPEVSRTIQDESMAALQCLIAAACDALDELECDYSVLQRNDISPIGQANEDKMEDLLSRLQERTYASRLLNVIATSGELDALPEKLPAIIEILNEDNPNPLKDEESKNFTARIIPILPQMKTYAAEASKRITQIAISSIETEFVELETVIKFSNLRIAEAKPS
ncbi:MAG: hypothetical protein AB7H77_01025 [Bdellovibrionales bacterium]